MTKNIKIGAASLNQTPLDWDNNYKNIVDALNQAKEAGVQILCLPEMSITGYGCEDHFLSKEVLDTAFDIVESLVEHTEGIFTCFGIPYLECNALYNVMVCVYDRSIIGIVPKQHLAGDGLHYEQRWFKPWPEGFIQKNEGYPVGDLVFNINGVIVGFEICEDAFVAGRPGNKLAQRGVDIILNPSASHFAFGKRITRERLVTEGSRAFNSIYVYANLLGNEAGRAIYDGDCLISSCGDLLARSPFLSMKKVNLTTAVVDLSKNITKAIGTASFKPNLLDFQSGIVDVVPSLYFCDERLTKPIYPNHFTKYEEFSLAITLGLLDYLEKSHSKGFVISLSGGADSAACALLVENMVKRAREDLEPDDLYKRLSIKIPDSFGKEIDKRPGTKIIVGKILTCVYQSAENSSYQTMNAARAVADELGAKFHVLYIDSIIDSYICMAQSIEGRTLTWEEDDLALQNIQARSRAPSVWMVANLENKLLITTSNRSEAAVGYCTMDGDTAGSISPIGGIDKAFLLDWLNHMANTYDCIKEIVCQKPTAELRPDKNQTDEDDLMPYQILDTIETWAILEKKGPQEVLDCLRIELKLDTDKAIGYVKKFFTLFSKNQWKRERFAPSMFLGSYNLDPKTWCRFPILSGGFAKELANLR